MKRKGNIYQDICTMDNLILAEKKARRGKQDQYGVQVFDKDPDNNLMKLQQMLITKTFHTSPYKIIKINDPKERDVYLLPYFPDRILQHAVMNPLESIFVSTFTTDTYSCIKRRGVHKASRYIKRVLKDVHNTQYCLKIDIRKFYPSIDHDILKSLLRRKIKDKDLLWLLDDIIDSAPGVPIGNYLSQYLANFYLTPFDHWLKEKMRVLYYMRYADDMVIPANNKPYLHWLLSEIRKYLWDNLRLEVKDNYQVFLTDSRGIDVLGYKHFHDYVLMRKEIKKNMCRAFAYNRVRSIQPYMGWATHCDSKHLIKKLTHAEFQ